MRRENSIDCPSLLPSWSVSRLKLSSRVVRIQPVLPSKQLSRYPLSWRLMAIRLETGSSPASRYPGGNITGLSTLAPEISGKQLELLKEIVPKLSRVAVLGNSTLAGNAQALKEVELAAGAFGVKVQYLEVRGPEDIETVFRAASEGRADAVLVLGSPVLVSRQTQVADLAAKNRLPAIYPQKRTIWTLVASCFTA